MLPAEARQKGFSSPALTPESARQRLLLLWHRLLHDRGMNVGVMKPVTSGCSSTATGLVSADAELLAWAAGVAVTPEVAPYLLKEPLAPSAAAEMEHVKIEFSRILAAFHRLAEQYDFIIVEGAGGLMVPLSGGLLVADLVKLLALPLLVVARPDLGTVNHTVLTTFAARQLEIDVRGVVISSYPETPSLAESTAPHLIDSLAGVPLLGRLPSIDSSDEKVSGGSACRLARHPTGNTHPAAGDRL